MASQMALAVKEKDPAVIEAARILVRMMAEDAKLAHKTHHVDVDGSEEPTRPSSPIPVASKLPYVMRLGRTVKPKKFHH
ncbi:hypothetical protein MMC07_004736 [Pseudocyphellaria aurata]|nr:hypothetical protein [Pseudocyphellaria aurata]